MAQGTNRLLQSLSSESRELILRQSTQVALPLRTSLCEAEEKIAYVYFLTSGMASVVTTSEEGDSTEVGVIGLEGMVGAVHLIGPANVSTRTFIQIEGAAIRTPADVMQKLFRSSEEIRDQILEFVQAHTLTVSQIAGCNRLHEAEARLARWLLMVRDRTESDALNLTQEFIGMMIGARRTTVSLVASMLQRSGYIEYSRGRVNILDGKNLEETACDCYQITKELNRNLYRKDRV